MNHKPEILYDAEGIPTKVILEYNDYLLLAGNPKPGKTLADLSEFVGILKFDGDPVAYQRALRDEWPD